jgi:hypothetical protein
VTEADAQGPSGDAGDAAAGHAPLHSQRLCENGPVGAGEADAVQALAQRRWHGRGQGADQDAVVDDVRQVAVQAQGNRATREGPTGADVPSREGDQAGGVDDPVDLDSHGQCAPSWPWSPPRPTVMSRLAVVRRDGLRPRRAGQGHGDLP